jgi:hypothetical protein
MSRIAGVFLAFVLVGGCSARDSDTEAAVQVTARFYDAFVMQDGATACAVLAPETAHAVEKSASAPCATALFDEELPDPGAVMKTDVFGSEARVVLAHDTVFLSDFNGTWKVAAAGCSERPALPYDCQIGD